MRGWWQTYGDCYGTGGLQIVTVWRGTQLIAVAPLYSTQTSGGLPGARHLRFISTGEEEHEETCADYLNVLCSREDEAVCIPSIWSVLNDLPWDHLELLDVPADSA